jgi:uncharacterized C2H2 Zn-finger protein
VASPHEVQLAGQSPSKDQVFSHSQTTPVSGPVSSPSLAHPVSSGSHGLLGGQQGRSEPKRPPNVEGNPATQAPPPPVSESLASKFGLAPLSVVIPPAPSAAQDVTVSAPAVSSTGASVSMPYAPLGSGLPPAHATHDAMMGWSAAPDSRQAPVSGEIMGHMLGRGFYGAPWGFQQMPPPREEMARRDKGDPVGVPSGGFPATDAGYFPATAMVDTSGGMRPWEGGYGPMPSAPREDGIRASPTARPDPQWRIYPGGASPTNMWGPDVLWRGMHSHPHGVFPPSGWPGHDGWPNSMPPTAVSPMHGEWSMRNAQNFQMMSPRLAVPPLSKAMPDPTQGGAWSYAGGPRYPGLSTRAMVTPRRGDDALTPANGVAMNGQSGETLPLYRRLAGDSSRSNHSHPESVLAPDPAASVQVPRGPDPPASALSINDMVSHWACPRCQEEFDQQSKLAAHMRTTHKATRAAICPHCSKTFVHAGHLKRHILSIHEKSKAHECPHCGRAFSELGNMRRHVRAVHEQVRMFKCDECTQTFSAAGNLKIHKQTVHRGLKAFRCPECSRLFGTSSNMIAHARAKHGVQQIWSCPYCDSSYAKHDSLVRHVHSLHEGKELPPEP